MSEEYHLLPAARVVPRSQVIAIIRAYSSVADRFLGNLEVNRNVQLLGEVLSLQSESLPDLGTSRCAVLTFGCLPRLNDGFVLGSDPKTCDITIGPDGKDVSARHLVVGFDNNEQVIMKDISSCGTHVSYSKRRDEYFRRAYTEEQGPFVWVLPPGWPVRVRIGKVLLEILVPDHSPYMEQYRHSVQGFRSDCRNRSPPIDSISIQRDVRETGSEKTPADGQTPRGTWTADDGSTTPRQGIQSRGMGAEGAVRSRPAPAEGNENEGLSDAVYIQDEESPALGSGSNGIVRKYYDASTWLLYAGKELKHGELDEEVILMENHPHDHIVKFVNNFRGRILMMEYCEHGSLRGLLKGRQPQSRFTERDSLQILYQCLQALVHLHERNVAHRDVTPANILFRTVSPVNVALADFGWAKETEDPMSSFQAGTPLYRAPEMALRVKKFQKSVDIWSLGVVAMECLLGLPTPADFGTDIANAIITHMETHAHDGNRSTRLIREMLRRNPSERPSARRCLREVGDILGYPPPESHDPLSAPDRTSNLALSPPINSGWTTVRPSGSVASGSLPDPPSEPGSPQSVTAIRARLHPAFPVTPASSHSHSEKHTKDAARPDTPSPQSTPAREYGIGGTVSHRTGSPGASRKRPVEDDDGSKESVSEKPEGKRRAVPRQ